MVCCFYKSKTGRYGYESQCKDCSNKRIQHWRKMNYPIVLEKQRLYYSINSSRINNCLRKYVSTNIEYAERGRLRARVYSNKKVVNITHAYAIDQLGKNGFSMDFIKNNPFIIEIKKLIIQTKRL